jgi:hypothetical protein
MEGAAMTLHRLMRHLAQLDLELAAEAALAAQVEAIAMAAREAGADGGEVQAAKMETLVGWRSAALRRCERGDVGVHPLSVLAPVVVAQGARAAAAVGAAVADALRGA